MGPVDGEVSVLVLCHTRELAFQIKNEYARFSKYLPSVKVDVFYGGVPISANKKALKEATPHIVVGTPGRLKSLIGSKDLNLSKLKHFVMDECDRLLEALDMRRDIQEICQDPMEIYVDDDTKLTLHGLQQYYVKLQEAEKNRKLNDLLDALDFNQVVIFVSKVARATELDRLLTECNFP